MEEEPASTVLARKPSKARGSECYGTPTEMPLLTYHPISASSGCHINPLVDDLGHWYLDLH